MNLLAVDNVSVRYGQLTALRGVSLAMAEGETLFVTGPNGAGKSTLLKAIAGVVVPRQGFISFAGQQIAAKPPEDIARLGFSMVPEGRHVFGALTIDENLRLGTGMRGDKDQAARDLEQIYVIFPMLAERKDKPAGVLSGGQQQMLVIGRALMASPKLIAIDEPSLGLAPKVIDDVYATLLKLRDTRGLTLLIVEQSATRASLTGGRMILLRSGEIALEGDARQLVRGEALKQAYFGYGSSAHG
jgi:branched-chain amino acid transport system ATP-binding protein